MYMKREQTTIDAQFKIVQVLVYMPILRSTIRMTEV